MKTSTEYRKRNHGITQDEDKQTEEIDHAWIRRLLPLKTVCFQTVRRQGLEHPRGIVDRRVTKSVKVWKSPEDLPRVIGRGLRDLSSRRIR